MRMRVAVLLALSAIPFCGAAEAGTSTSHTTSAVAVDCQFGTDKLAPCAPLSSGYPNQYFCVGTTGKAQTYCALDADLAGASDVAVSPDGQNVYATSYLGDSLVTFVRNAPWGKLSSPSCIGNTGTGGKTCTPAPGLDGPEAIVLSPDGKSLYTASGNSNAIDVFSRAPNGSLTALNCVGATGANPAGCATTANLKGVQALAVSPDGKSLYAAANGSNAIELFTRSDSGALVETGCIGNTGAAPAGCTAVDGLAAPATLAVSSDGNNVYVGADKAVVMFNRSASGALTSAGCIGNTATGPPGCAVKTDGLSGVNSLAVSPEGANMYVAASDSNAIVEFSRGSAGALAPIGCVGNAGPTNAGPASCIPIPGLYSAWDVKVSPDGRNVYTAGLGSDAFDTFGRAPDGTLPSPQFVSCWVGSPSLGCDIQAGLTNPSSVALSPDGISVYVTGETPGAVLEFVRLTPDLSKSVPVVTHTPTTPVAPPRRVPLSLSSAAFFTSNGSRYIQLTIRTAPHPNLYAKVTLINLRKGNSPFGLPVLSQSFKVAKKSTRFKFTLPTSVGKGSYEVLVAIQDRGFVRHYIDIAKTAYVVVPSGA